MSPDQVFEKMVAFASHVRREQELRDQLEALEFNAPNDKTLARAVERQEALLREIRDLREEKMVPMVDQITEFVARRQSELLEL